MIAFASLFLGLVMGVRPVELVVGAKVSSVELLLDDRAVGQRPGPPWMLSVDFGDEIEPHELVAVARDSEGREVGRVKQRINLPRSLAEAAIVLEPGSGGRGRIARLTWQSVVGTVPKAVSVTFDGKPLPAPDPHRIEIPPHVPEQLHFLRAELDFAENIGTVAEVMWGGRYKDQTQTELTAVSVVLERLKELPHAEALQDWFTEGGRPLRVTAVEEGPAEVAAVMDLEARRLIDRMVEATRRSIFMRDRLTMTVARDAAALKKNQRLRFIWPFPRLHPSGGSNYLLFPRSEDFSPSDGGIPYLVTRVPPPTTAPAGQRLADAVAVAALSAVGRNRSRAVLLILTGDPIDASDLPPGLVRRYLARIGVPLVVWNVEGEAAPARGAWGDAVDASSLDLMEAAVKKLAKDLERQRIVWVEGAHLPQSIALTPMAAGRVSLAR